MYCSISFFIAALCSESYSSTAYFEDICCCTFLSRLSKVRYSRSTSFTFLASATFSITPFSFLPRFFFLASGASCSETASVSGLFFFFKKLAIMIITLPQGSITPFEFFTFLRKQNFGRTSEKEKTCCLKIYFQTNLPQSAYRWISEHYCTSCRKRRL